MSTTIEIIDYTEEYAGDFRKLNLEWLEKFNLLESHDLEVIDDPNTTILLGGNRPVREIRVPPHYSN